MFIKEESEVKARKSSPRIPGQRTAGPEPDSTFPGEAPGDMEPSAKAPSQSPTAMLIRIFGRKDQELYGDIVHYGLKKPVPDRGAAELVLRIDAISRSLGYSSAESPGTSENRFHSVRRIRGGTGNILPEEYWREEEAGPPPRVRDTIYLQLIGIQHTSIQGRICGKVTKKKYITFRSALELIYLLSEAV